MGSVTIHVKQQQYFLSSTCYKVSFRSRIPEQQSICSVFIQVYELQQIGQIGQLYCWSICTREQWFEYDTDMKPILHCSDANPYFTRQRKRMEQCL